MLRAIVAVFATLLLTGCGPTIPASQPTSAPIGPWPTMTTGPSQPTSSAAVGVAAPNKDMAAAEGDRLCAAMQDCTGSRLLSVFPITDPDGRHEWEATYKFAKRHGPARIEVDDLSTATGQSLRLVDAWDDTKP